MDEYLEERAPEPPEPDAERVKARAKEIRREWPDADDVEGAAKRLLKESDARTSTDPAPKDLSDDRVERRHSEETTPPPDTD